MSKLLQFFKDDYGDYSCMRLAVFMVITTVLLVWGIGCFIAGYYIPLGYAEAGIISSAIFGKAAQDYIENEDKK
jgi:hypothetical protein